MSKLLIFGFHGVNEFGKVNVGAYVQAHPAETLVIGLGMVFALYLITKLFVK